MITNGDFTGRVVNNIRALNKDGRISRRHVLNVGKVKSAFYITQKLGEHSLFKDEGIITYMDCVKLNSVSPRICGIAEFSRCSDLMRTVERLPETLYTRQGSSIVSVSSVDEGYNEGITFTPITPRQYQQQKNRSFSKAVPPHFYYVKDGYLYLPNSQVKLLNIALITLDTRTAKEQSSCSGFDFCQSAWEDTFICPEKLLEQVTQETIEEVLRTYKAITPDENPNMDNNQKSSTVN